MCVTLQKKIIAKAEMRDALQQLSNQTVTPITVVCSAFISRVFVFSSQAFVDGIYIRLFDLFICLFPSTFCKAANPEEPLP